MHIPQFIKSILWVGGAGALAYFAVTSHERWRSGERIRLIAKIEVEYGVPVFKYLQDGALDWVPYPWQEEKRTSESLLREIQRSFSQRLAKLKKTANSEGKYNELFPQYFSLWSNRLALCKTLEQDEKTRGIVQGCSGLTSQALGHDWTNPLRHYYSGSYIDGVVDPPELRQKINSRERVCNLTPLDITLERVARLAQRETVDFYRRHLSETIGSHHLDKIELAAGECKLDEVSGLGVSPEAGNVYYYPTYRDQPKEEWFRDIWSRFHAPALLDAAFMAEKKRAYIEDVDQWGAWYCAGLKDWFDSDHQKCNKGQKRPFRIGMFLSDGSRFLAIDYPSLPTAAIVTSNEKNTLDEVSLQAAQEEVRRWAALSNKQYGLMVKWASRKPRFTLTGDDRLNISDADGPLTRGVQIRGLPNTTILKESLSIPDSGTVLAIYSERDKAGTKTLVSTEVSSIYDILEALEEHGSSREAGIRAPLFLALEGHNAWYATRHRFALDVEQEFDTRTDGWTVCKSGFQFGALFGAGTWEDKQQFAYYAQVDAPWFGFCDFGGSLVTFVGASVIIGGPIAQGMKGWVAKAAVYGTVDAALTVGHVLLTAPSLQSRELTAEMATKQAKIAFALGAILAPIVRR